MFSQFLVLSFVCWPPNYLKMRLEELITKGNRKGMKHQAENNRNDFLLHTSGPAHPFSCKIHTVGNVTGIPFKPVTIFSIYNLVI